MPQDNQLNVAVLQQFINQVKAADLGRQKEIRLDINTAKNLSYTLALAMSRLAGNYEDLLSQQKTTEAVVSIEMDGGSWDKN